MAANLTGMFNQLNQAVLSNPMAGQQGKDLVASLSQNLGNVASGATGLLTNGQNRADPYSFMTPQAKMMQGQKDLARQDLSTTRGLQKASEIYGKMGNTQNQMAAAKAARTQAMEEAKLQKEQKLREGLAAKFRKYGYNDQADAITSGATDLAKDMESLRDIEIIEVTKDKGTPARKRVAKMMGIDDETFDAEGYADLTDEQFAAALNGFEAEAKAFTNANGQATILRENKGGKVKDPNSERWVDPSELGLKPNINVQKVINSDNIATTEFIKAGVENFADLYEKANGAASQLGNIERGLQALEDMPTGIGAPAQAFFMRVADYLGMPQPSLENYQAFVSEAGKRVAEQIKAFGSGTGLSDADREYAKLIAAADPALAAGSLKRLLEIQKRAAQATIDTFTEAKGQFRDNLPAETAPYIDSFVINPGAVGGNPETPDTPPSLTWNPDTGAFK